MNDEDIALIAALVLAAAALALAGWLAWRLLAARAELARLRESERGLRTIMDHVPALLSQFDREARCVHTNPYCGVVYGIDYRRMVGMTIREVRGDSYAQMAGYVARALAGEQVNFESRAVIRGVERFFQQNYVPDFDEQGQVRGFFSLSIEITDRVRAERLLARSEERMRSILTHAPDAFISMDTEGRITEWNRQAEATFGWDRDEVLGRMLSEVIIPPAERAAHDRGVLAFTRSGTGAVVNRRREVSALHRAGHEIPVEISVAALREGEVFTATAFLRDISERQAAQARMAASLAAQEQAQQRLRTVTDNLPVLISYIDREQRLRFVNRTLRDWTGLDPERSIGRTVREVVGGDEYDKRRDFIERALRGERVFFELESDALGVHRQLQNVYIPDLRPDGTVAGIYTLSTDVTAIKAVERHLDQLARVDPLTGLPNRREFEERLPAAMARSRRAGRPLALLFLDLDRLKSVNDRHGHGVGDEVLKVFGRRLCECVRATDAVARLAGDEFIVILEGLNDADEPLAVGRKMLAAVAEPFRAGELPLALTTSMGVAIYAGDDESAPALMARADAALYEAKAAGRNTLRVAPPARHTNAAPAGAVSSRP